MLTDLRSLRPWRAHLLKLHSWRSPVFVLLSLLALGLFALARGSGAAAQARQGVITYSGADHNIWRIGADGGDRRQLTQDGTSDNPVWLPGGQIAFSSIRDQRAISTTAGTITLNQIYLMGSDGSNPTRLSDGSADDKFPQVITGGGRIVFLRNHNWRVANGAAVHDTEVGSMRLDGTDYRIHGSQVTDPRTRIDRYPASVSSDGTKIVLIRQAQGQTSQIQVLDVASGQFSTLALDIDRGTAPGTVEYLWPRFDPQGHIVVLRRVYTFGPVDVSLISMDANGKNIQSLIGAMQFESLANGFDVNWAARTVIAARAPELPGGLRPEEIYLYDLATGTSSPPLDSGHAPSFTLGAATPPQPTLTPAPLPPGAATPTGEPVPPGPSPTPGPPLISTADPLFYAAWERVDRPVKENAALRSWIWGPVGRAVEHEPYGSTTRLVQYFDKARMELNPAVGDGPSFVSNGLLVVELLSGRIQVGPNSYQLRSPAGIPLGGDGPGNPSPSFATLARFASLAGENKAAPALHQPVTTTLSSNGTLGSISFPATERIGYFAPQTSHNIPEVFFNFFNQTGKIYTSNSYHTGIILDWVFTVGYPISEPYWTQMAIAGKVRPVLVQAFQRQVLTYIPEYQPPWNVQFGNVGLQYYQWRYGHLP